MVNTMSTDVVTVRLPPKDTELIDFFVGGGEFKSRSDFLRYAVKKMVAELIQKELDTAIVTKKVNKKELDRIQKTIKKIRKDVWSDHYAESVR